MGLWKSLIFLFIFLGGNSVAGEGTDWSRLEVLERSLQKDVKEGRLAGGVLYIGHNGKTVFHKAFGWQDIEAGIPMTTSSLHRVASQTKALTSAAIMILQERGHLLISDPLGKYFPEWSATTVAIADENEELGYRTEPAKRPITIRDLLTHTAGVNYGALGSSRGADRGVIGIAWREWQRAGFEGWYFAGDAGGLREKVRLMASLPQVAHPGEAFVYGFSTDILGALIEHISGQTLQVFLSNNIFQPLQMYDTYFFVPALQAARLTTVYGSTTKGLIRLPEAQEDSEAQQFYRGQGHYLERQLNSVRSYSGGAGAVSTAEDYSKFLEMLRLNGRYKNGRILGRKSVELMTINHLAPDVEFRPGSGFGLGFNVVTDLGLKGQLGSEASYGWGGAYHSIYWVDPRENLIVSYMTQLIPANNIDDHARIRALIYQAID